MWREANPQRRETPDGCKSRISKGVSAGKVSPWVEGGCEEETRPLQTRLRVEDLSFQGYGEVTGRFVTHKGPAVNQFGLGGTEGDVTRRGPLLEQ